LLAYHGLITTAQDRARGWEIYSLPTHPLRIMSAYLLLAAALPFLSAWLMRPQQAESTREEVWVHRLWRIYTFWRVGFWGWWSGGCLVNCAYYHGIYGPCSLKHKHNFSLECVY